MEVNAYSRGMADEPDWAKILRHLYTNAGGVESRMEFIDEDWDDSTKEVEQLTALEKKIGHAAGIEATPQQVQENLNKMERWGLAKILSSATEAVVSLEPPGFEVAHERELSRRREKTNSALVVFTFVLVIVGVVGNLPNPDARIFGNLLIVGGLLGILYWTELFDLPGV